MLPGVKANPRLSRHWLVVIGAHLVMVAGSVPLSGLALFNPYIFDSLPGVAQPEILFYYTLMMLAIVGAMVFVGGPLLARVNPQVLMTAGAVVVAGGLGGFMMATSTTMLYASAVLLGVGYGFSYQLIPVLWVNNWFAKRKGLVLGLVFSGTGIGGITWSFIVPRMGGAPGVGVGGNPESFRTGYLVMAGIVLLVTVLPTLFLIRNKPADVGLTPYGLSEDPALAVGARSGADSSGVASSPGHPAPSHHSPGHHSPSRPLPGFTYEQAVRSPWLWLVFSMSAILGMVHSSSQILAPYLTMRVVSAPPDGLGAPMSYYSLLMMTWTFGLILMKPTLGFLNDRIGIVPAMTVTLSLYAIFFAVFLPNIHNMGMVLPVLGMLFTSAGIANGTIQPPLITAAALGNRDFGRIWSIAGSAYMLGNALGAPIWGLFYNPDTGSYLAGFYLAPVALAIYVLGSAFAMKRGKRRYMELFAAESDPLAGGTQPA